MSLVARRNHLPHVYQVLKKRGFVKKKGDTREYTHTVVDGGFVGFGPIEIPDDDPPLYLQLFYTEYAKSWERNERIYMVEWPRLNQPHRLYFDLDMYFAADSARPDITELSELFATIQNTLLSRIFPSLSSDRCTLIVGTGGYSNSRKRLGRDQQVRDLVKLGLHLIWRDVFVETTWLPAIRNAILTALETRFHDGVIPLASGSSVGLLTSWDSVVDENIARRASSRMFGSAKLDWCHCRQDNIECTHDKDRSGKGRVDVGRVYELAAVVDQDGEMMDSLFRKLNSNKVQLLFAVSLCIRPTFPLPDDIGIDVTDCGREHGSATSFFVVSVAKCILIDLLAAANGVASPLGVTLPGPGGGLVRLLHCCRVSPSSPVARSPPAATAKSLIERISDRSNAPGQLVNK